MVERDDWRIQGQEKYLAGSVFKWKSYTKYRDDWDHDHCEFCGAKFMEPSNPDSLHEGYSTEDNYRWVCKTCFDDFKEMFGLKVEK